MSNSKENLRIQRLVVIVGLVLFAIKIVAWYITASVAILTDALESTVNVVASFIGLYSLILSAKPRDMEHPYGHGKVEFISAGIEGSLITVAGLVIIYEAINNLRHPHEIGSLDYGILLVVLAAAVNYGVGLVAVKKGEKNNSLALIASGKHLQSDTYSSVGIIVGLAIMRFTGWAWVDSVVALIFAFVIIFTGLKIVRSSIAGIMDEVDTELLDKVVASLNEHREANWVDIHNLRIIKYGSVLHLDFHMTVPWYLNVNQAHDEVDKIDRLAKVEFGESVEMFVHTDGCMSFSCPICAKSDCQVRQANFVKQLEWTVGNISSNQKHRLEG
jgi:cation diffusion facilitator family transporter